MNIPTMSGLIDRRILINYRVNQPVVAAFLPAPFRPKLVENLAIVGICLIRLRHVRPKGLPGIIGVGSENAAHRIAVEWDDEHGVTHEGVFVPRRDTSSRLNALAGGRLFPGVHQRSDFLVKEADGSYDIRFDNADGTHLRIQATETDQWPADSVFGSLSEASAFLQAGSVGYSPRRGGEAYDGLELRTRHWSVSPLRVAEVESSFFANSDVFPVGSVVFDNALLMRHIPHEWLGKPRLARQWDRNVAA